MHLRTQHCRAWHPKRATPVWLDSPADRSSGFEDGGVGITRRTVEKEQLDLLPTHAPSISSASTATSTASKRGTMPGVVNGRRKCMRASSPAA